MTTNVEFLCDVLKKNYPMMVESVRQTSLNSWWWLKLAAAYWATIFLLCLFLRMKDKDLAFIVAGILSVLGLVFSFIVLLHWGLYGYVYLDPEGFVFRKILSTLTHAPN